MAIDIKVSKDTSQLGQAPESAPQVVEQGRPSATSQAANTAIINAGKQVLSAGIREYGNITGDYLVQESIDNALSIAADVLTIAKGGAIGALYVGTRYAVSMFASNVAQERAYRDLALARDRAGKIYVSGGR